MYVFYLLLNPYMVIITPRRPKADIGYHTHGAIDFCVGRDGLPKAWTSFPMPSWVEELYGGHIELETGGEYGGIVGYYPF